MTSPASIAKHPLHPMLVALPIGLWIFSLVSDVIYVMKWGSIVFNDVAFYTMAGGIVVALFAVNLWLRRDAVPGAALPVWLSVVGVALLGVSGWLGGELVYVHGVAVQSQQSDVEHIATQREIPRRAA